eukprot:CAMPEP_0196661222 /NCGR_PEP_ID=MMETSP1086-20130531/43289_1 /TAXON_ID=77921 /ORGANISM="Cyanoptyche  gloeocystis , Strain SAG4.97" /LENGTH=52 /DNA_ID=CAMNT_0041996019 /DNA_START=10 /DNA_END=168 /DNA_ORIENTATION=-
MADSDLGKSDRRNPRRSSGQSRRTRNRQGPIMADSDLQMAACTQDNGRFLGF